MLTADGLRLTALRGVRYAHGFLYDIDIASLIDERCRCATIFYCRAQRERAERAITKKCRAAFRLKAVSRYLSAVGFAESRACKNAVKRNLRFTAFVYVSIILSPGDDYIIPPMPPIPPAGIWGMAGLSSGASPTIASVVRTRAAMEAAFWRAVRVTFAGSTMPALIMSS